LIVVEVELTGGNSGAVFKVNETVRRTTGAWTPAVHLLLHTLRSAGIHNVPEPLGIDDVGREILTFLPGEVANYPLPDWLWAPSVIEDVGRLLRRIHDASAPVLGTSRAWQLPTHEPAEVVCHNDVAPYNMVFENGRLAGLIDFDTASPGPRVWDIAYLAYRLVPFVSDAGDSAPSAETQLLERLDSLLDAYGHSFPRAAVFATMADRLVELAEYTDRRATDMHRADFVEHAAMYRKDAQRALGLAEVSAV
jgi:Ser/Thr protein kinase RdoA (MazF antagonist)